MSAAKPVSCSFRIYDGRTMRGRHCSLPAKRDGFCAVHHPEAVAARRRKTNARVEADIAAGQARTSMHQQTVQDANRMAWLNDHAADIVADVRVWQWIDDHRLRMGGTRACIDHLMNMEGDGNA